MIGRDLEDVVRLDIGRDREILVRRVVLAPVTPLFLQNIPLAPGLRKKVKARLLFLVLEWPPAELFRPEIPM